EPLGAPPPVQFNIDFGAGLDAADPFEGTAFGGDDFDEEDWSLGAELGRREPPTKEFRLRLRRGADMVWVEVFDSDMRLPRIRSAGETDEGGRGLYLVDQLARRWGSRPTPEGKAVWFEIPIRSR
ncbi:MAG TPA: ATP-binding protein, partial [Thermopolyspora sp.]